jgi:hypothetical protein
MTHPRHKSSIRQLHWLPVLAAALMLYRCYIPGRSALNLLGIVLWLCIVPFWLGTFAPAIKRLPAWPKLPFWQTSILLGLSLAAFSRLPFLIGLYCSLPQFEEFARQLRQKPVCYKRQYLDRDSPVRMQLGIYPLYDWAVDGNGGVYFVTTVDSPFINTELTGFASKPSHELRLFERIGNSRFHLWGDWYLFNQIEKF